MAGFATSFLGQPSVAPTLTDLMDAWIKEVENQSVLSEDNQGDNSPQALAAECIKVAQSYISELQAFSPPPPDAVIATALPYQSRILFEASFVPPQQWSPATYSAALPNTIALAMAAAQSAAPPPPPPPPVAGPRVGACYQGPNGIICEAGPGSTLQNTVNGQQYINAGGDNKPYMAHIAMGLPGMVQMWYTPAAPGS